MTVQLGVHSFDRYFDNQLHVMGLTTRMYDLFLNEQQYLIGSNTQGRLSTHCRRFGRIECVSGCSQLFSLLGWELFPRHAHRDSILCRGNNIAIELVCAEYGERAAIDASASKITVDPKSKKPYNMYHPILSYDDHARIGGVTQYKHVVF